MSNPYSKPSGSVPGSTSITIPEKATLNVFSSPVDSRLSHESSPRSLKSDNPFDTDVEAQALATTESMQNCVTKSSTNLNKTKSDCQVWPGKDHWQRRDKAAKMKRSCSFMAGLSSRNKIIAKVLIILLIVGIGVGVGFGVSKPLGAPIWGDKDHQ
jgi:hypothetical protein